MKYCEHCGKELNDEAVICTTCGCAVKAINSGSTLNSDDELVQKLSSRINTNGVIWMVIGILQIIFGIINVFALAIGIYNIVSAVKDMKYSKLIITDRNNIVSKFEPLGLAIFLLIYNLTLGGFFGVVGSIYYLICVRGFVMENQIQFNNMNNFY